MTRRSLTADERQVEDLLAEVTARQVVSDTEEAIASFRSGHLTFGEVLWILSRAGLAADGITLPRWRPFFEERSQ